MTPDDLKRYNVSVGSGSGCFFQPLTTEYTYILTAKHLFQREIENQDTAQSTYEPLEEGTAVDIYKHTKTAHGWLEDSIPFILNTGENYFAHPDADAAILKVPFIGGFEEILVEYNVNSNLNYLLCGFPSDYRYNNPGEKDSILNVERILTSGNFCHRAQLLGTINYDNVVGMSGGGYLKLENNHLSILGIQSKMATKEYQALGQVGFVPIRYFDEIVNTMGNPVILERLLPGYLSSFSFFQDDIFSIKLGVQEQNRKNKLTAILKAKATKIYENDITPVAIQEYLKEKLLLIEQNKFELQGKRIWTMWLELLTILNVAKDKSHGLADLGPLFKKIRMFYSDIDDDFWINHLHELHKQDYSGLESGGLVVVASKRPALGQNSDFLVLENVAPQIDRAREDFDLNKIRINESAEFPFDEYSFINISAFKERTVSELDEQFANDQINNCLITLKQLYERFIPEW